MYRYRPYRADELRLLLAAGQVRFSDANFFNDPWDCRPLLRIPYLLDQREEDERWIGWLVGIKQRERDATAHSVEDYRAKLRTDRPLLHKEVATAGRVAIKRARDRYRLLCLSANGDIPLMWSHYASAHAGVCQIFDAKDEVIGQAEKVIYLPGYPAIDFPDDDNSDLLTATFLTKARYWKYETEFRVIAKEGAANAESHFIPSHQGYVQIKPSALIGLILGCQINPKHREEAIAIARAATNKVEIYQAHLDEESYQLKILKSD